MVSQHLPRVPFTEESLVASEWLLEIKVPKAVPSLCASINCRDVKVKQDKSRLKSRFTAVLTSAVNDFALSLAQGWPGT